MAIYTCKVCSKEFKSKHSVAQYCSRSCAWVASSKQQKGKPRQRKISEDSLLGALREKAAELGRTPTKREFKWTDLLRHHYGSFNAGVIAAGLTPNTKLPPKFFEASKDARAVPAKLRFQILKRDNFKCQYCGGTPAEGFTLHVDHVVPFSKGGKTAKDNLITACWLCNEGKGNSSLYMGI